MLKTNINGKEVTKMKIIFIIVCIEVCSLLTHGLEPVTTAVIIGISSVIVWYNDKIIKKGGQILGYYEGCEDHWIPGNMNGLEFDLKKNVYGQPLALDIILESLSYHYFRRKYPTKPLVLSFHGPPGVGKNYVSQMILKNMFRKGSKTEYVHFFRGSIDFTVSRDIFSYKETILKIIKSKAEECNRSIFIFDEVEKMPRGVLSVLRPFLDKHESIGGIDYRNTIFIFLSNVGGREIIEKTLEFWRKGVPREEFKIQDFDKLIMTAAYNEEGGFHSTDIVKSHLVDFFIPFLPMEKKHVRQCLERDVGNMGQIMSDELEKQVFDQLTFYPEPEEIYAINGCKLLSEKAAALIQREVFRKRKSQQNMEKEEKYVGGS